jgi:hypothetical protein
VKVFVMFSQNLLTTNSAKKQEVSLKPQSFACRDLMLMVEMTGSESVEEQNYQLHSYSQNALAGMTYETWLSFTLHAFLSTGRLTLGLRHGLLRLLDPLSLRPLPCFSVSTATA